jgi:predicted deacylase
MKEDCSMAKKEIVRLTVVDKHNDHETFIPLGIVEGKNPGPTLAVLGGVHGSEYSAHEGAARFWASLDPEELSGKVFVVLAADVEAMCGHSLYVNPVDGKNLNRVWPGKADGTLTEVIAYTITEEVVKKADAVIDCHGGEFDESISLFIITHSVGDEELDQRNLDLAMALGMPFVEVTDAYGAFLGTGTGSGEAMKGGRPGITLEAGGRGLEEEFYVSATYNSLQNALYHMGIKKGEPFLWAGKPVTLDHGVILKTTQAGIYRPAVEVFQWMEAGDLFARVMDFDGTTVLEEIRVPEAGTVLDVISARAIRAGGFAGKIGVI